MHDLTNQDLLVAPSDRTDPHSRGVKLECNVGKVALSMSKRNRASKSKRFKIHAGKHAMKRSRRGTLVDRGANGGMLGNDARVIFKRNKIVVLEGKG